MRFPLSTRVTLGCALLLAIASIAATEARAQGVKKTPARAVPVKASRSAPVVVAPTALTVEEPAVVVPPEPQVAMLAGVVEDSVGTPIIDAEIAILGTSLRTRSGLGGTWRIAGVAPGPIMLSARRVGFQPFAQTMHLRDGETRAIDLTMAELAEKPFELPPTYIIAPRLPYRSVFQQGFFARKSNYPGGTFFTRDDILLMRPVYTSDVFRTTPGFYQYRDRRGQTQWIIRGASTTQNCPIRFFIDGMNVPLNGMSIDELVQPSDIEGIEIYKGVSTVPAEYSGKSMQDDSRCGVVAVWTRVNR